MMNLEKIEEAEEKYPAFISQGTKQAGSLLFFKFYFLFIFFCQVGLTFSFH